MSYCTVPILWKASLATPSEPHYIKGRSVTLVLYKAIITNVYLHSKNEGYKASNNKQAQSCK